jgi:hypothetical protein
MPTEENEIQKPVIAQPETSVESPDTSRLEELQEEQNRILEQQRQENWYRNFRNYWDQRLEKYHFY